MVHVDHLKLCNNNNIVPDTQDSETNIVEQSNEEPSDYHEPSRESVHAPSMMETPYRTRVGRTVKPKQIFSPD